MNYKIATVALTSTLIVTGCASMGQQGRIGSNDGSDPCFANLQNIDSIAIFYKDERMKQLMGGAALGAVSGAALGAGTAALTNGDAAIGALIGGIAGGVAGAFVANSYWESRMQQANQQKSLAIGMVEKDLRDDIAKITQVDQEIGALVRCRTQKRDQIRKDFAAGKLTHAQAELEWKKWGDLINKDREEMTYIGEALENIQKIEESYNYAASVIEPGYASSAPVAQVAAPVEEEVDITSPKKGKGAKKGKVNKKRQNVAGAPDKAKKADVTGAKAAPKKGKITTLVASMHEKYESINKNKGAFEQLALEAKNSKGFEQIESSLPAAYRWVANPLLLSGMVSAMPMMILAQQESRESVD